jgi:hypothetical protein
VYNDKLKRVKDGWLKNKYMYFALMWMKHIRCK